VGGYIERLPLGQFDLIINEEGRLIDLEPNRMIDCGGLASRTGRCWDVVGPLFVTRGNDEGDWVSLTEVEAAMLVDMLNSESDVCRTLKPEEVEEPFAVVTSWEEPK
jgi:hypothetical protein